MKTAMYQLFTDLFSKEQKKQVKGQENMESTKQLVKRDLGFGSLGNGISVYDRLHEEHGDYQKVAHINADREVTYYVELSPEDTETIEKEARESDPSISYSQQDQKVFNTRPPEEIGPTPEEEAENDAALEEYEAWQEQAIYDYLEGGNEVGKNWDNRQDQEEDIITAINESLIDAWEREKALRLEHCQWNLDFVNYYSDGLREFFANNDISEKHVSWLMGDTGDDCLEKWIVASLVVEEGYTAKENLFSVDNVREVNIPLKGITNTPVSDEDREFINNHSQLFISEKDRYHGSATSDSIYICVDADKVKSWLECNPMVKDELSYSSPGM
jgi:hypothetical protein